MGNRYDYTFKMKYTDNPYIDLIVNCVKILGMNAITKNENQALHYEDLRSSMAAGKFIKFKEGNWNQIKDGPYAEYNYMEWNSYYRMLNGLPPAYTLNDEKAYLQATGYEPEDIYEDIGPAFIIPELYKRYFIDMGQYKDDLQGKYLHELDEEQLAVIIADGTLDQIKADYAEDTHYQYIYHLGDKRIDYYTARKAVNFSLLYVPKLNTFDIIENKFKRMYDRNRRYTMATVYSEAYRFMSYHYDAFIQILIIIQTMVDMISEVQEYIINKDVFDSRTIRYLFESYGIAYYKEIPVKYQIRIIKNVNKLLKYKSSNRNITDILELFDNDDIVVYTYYLMKTKRINREDFFYYTKDDINPKYHTNREYYLGRMKDITNNKIPLMNVPYMIDDTTVEKDENGEIIKDNFIRTYVYGYSLKDEKHADTSINRVILPSDYQPIAGKIADSINVLHGATTSNSFICDFLDNIAYKNDLPWFGTSRYNKDTVNSTRYLEERSTLLSNIKEAISNVIKLVFDEETSNDPTFGLNAFHYRRIKYRIYSILGLFKYDKSIDFDNITDEELNSSTYFYNADTEIDEAYCALHGLDYNTEIETENKYMLNHTIPFMVWMPYKAGINMLADDDEDTPKTISDYFGDQSNYIFNTNSTFGATPSTLGDLYERYTRIFRENYCVSVRVYVEAVFDSLAYDALNNPTPRYVGWMDIGNVIEITGMSLDELQLGDIVSTIDNDLVPVYKTPYVYEVITEDMIGKEYFRKNYNLCFLKVPLLDPNASKVLERKDMRRSYDSITLADPFWDGVSTFDILTDEERDKLHQSKKQQILNKEFTIERTKYIAVEASIDLVKMSYQLSYFMNMLYDKHIDEEDLYVEVDPELSSAKVRLNDLLTFAIALNFIYNGVEPDNIASDMEKNMYINGFNFDTDWNDIYNYLQNKHFINNNYENEIHDYSYINEFGETISNTGYGMSPMDKGWLSERFDDWFVYDADNDIKVYYGMPTGTVDSPILPSSKINDIPNAKPYYSDEDHHIPNPSIGAFLSGRYNTCPENCSTTAKLNLDFGHSDIWCYNLEKHPIVNEYGEIRTIDISWKPTQYTNDDNNSHGLWLDTDILTRLDSSTSDLEKINMLKKIYYSNTNLYDHLTYMMRHAESKRMYDIYKVLFDSFMETKMNHDYYGLIDESGSPVYSDSENPDDLFYLTSAIDVLYDKDGYPYFRGFKLEPDRDIDEGLFTYSHNDDFSECRYTNINGLSVDCLYYDEVYKQTGKKDYVIHDNYLNQFPRKYYMVPNLDGYFFRMEEILKHYLVSKQDPTIKIEVTVDDENNIVDDEGHKITDSNYKWKYIIKDGKVIRVNKGAQTSPDDKVITITRKIADSYYDFLQYRNPSLYSHLIDLKYNYTNTAVTDPTSKTTYYVPSDEKRRRIEVLCELIASALEKYFDKNEWKYIFNLIPTANIENVQRYIMKMVIFFKSWKTQILDTSISYIIDDPFNNHVHILDDMYYTTKFDNLLEKVRPKDYKYFHNHTEYKDPIKIGEKYNLKSTYFEPYEIKFGFGEKMYGHNFDFPSLTSKLTLTDKVSPSEKVEMHYVEYKGDVQKDANGNVLLP